MPLPSKVPFCINNQCSLVLCFPQCQLVFCTNQGSSHKSITCKSGISLEQLHFVSYKTFLPNLNQIFVTHMSVTQVYCTNEPLNGNEFLGFVNTGKVCNITEWLVQLYVVPCKAALLYLNHMFATYMQCIPYEAAASCPPASTTVTFCRQLQACRSCVSMRLLLFNLSLSIVDIGKKSNW